MYWFVNINFYQLLFFHVITYIKYSVNENSFPYQFHIESPRR